MVDTNETILDPNTGATGPAGATGPSSEGTTGAGESGAVKTEVAKTGAAQSGAVQSGSTMKAPEKYDLKLPEGSLLGQDRLEKIASFAKERGFSNDVAQEILNRENALLVSYAEGQQVEAKKLSGTWMESSRTDKEFGGTEFGKNAELAKRVVQRYGSDELKKGLSETGFGNHPELVRMLVRIGKTMSEDQLVMPGSQSAETKKIEDVFYPQKS